VGDVECRRGYNTGRSSKICNSLTGSTLLPETGISNQIFLDWQHQHHLHSQGLLAYQDEQIHNSSRLLDILPFPLRRNSATCTPHRHLRIHRLPATLWNSWSTRLQDCAHTRRACILRRNRTALNHHPEHPCYPVRSACRPLRALPHSGDCHLRRFLRGRLAVHRLLVSRCVSYPFDLAALLAQLRGRRVHRCGNVVARYHCRCCRPRRKDEDLLPCESSGSWCEHSWLRRRWNLDEDECVSSMGHRARSIDSRNYHRRVDSKNDCPGG
jgi:hypothetical protein